MDDYYIPFFNYILNELDSHQACAALGLCKSTGADFFAVRTAVPLILLVLLSLRYSNCPLTGGPFVAPVCPAA